MKIVSLIAIVVVLLIVAACSSSDVAVMTAIHAPSNTPNNLYTPTPDERWGIYTITLSRDNSLTTWHNAVPVVWRNPNERRALYRIALNETSELYETCEYRMFGVSPTMFRIHARYSIVNVEITNLETGRRVAQTAFSGIPPVCPDEIETDFTRNSRTIVGEPPSPAEFRQWMMNVMRATDEDVLATISPTPTITYTPTRTPIPTATPRPPHTPEGMTPVAEGNNLAIVGITFVRDENGETIAELREGSFPLLGHNDESYIILYEGHASYVLLSARNVLLTTPFTPTPIPTDTPRPVHTPVNMTPVADGNSLVITGPVNIRDEHGDSLILIDDGEFPLLGLTEDAYIILFEGHPSYVLLTATNARAEINLTPTQTFTPRPPHTPMDMTSLPNDNSLIITGSVIIQDENGETVAVVDEGEYPLLGVTNTHYVILYAGNPAYVQLTVRFARLSMPLATPTITSTPRSPHTPVGLIPVPEGTILVITALVSVRDERQITIDRIFFGEYPLLGLTETSYVILYEGYAAYVDITSAGAHPATGD